MNFKFRKKSIKIKAGKVGYVKTRVQQIRRDFNNKCVATIAEADL